MSNILTQEQVSRLQEEVQQELERREWAESGDTVMAEYICVLLGNGNTRERVKSEMEDLVGTDFDAPFLDWLFARRDAIREPAAPAPVAPASPPKPAAPAAAAPAESAPASRLFASAIEGTKRKADPAPEVQNKRRLPDGPLGAPTGPRAMQNQNQQGQNQYAQGGANGAGAAAGRSLVDRLAPRGARPGMNARGGMAPGAGPRMGNQPFRPQGGFQQQQQQQQNFMPGQEEMMMQMMAMQANMMQMAQQMAQMQESQQTQSRPTRSSGPRSTSKVPPGTKLGGHAVSSVQPPRGALGAIPDKPVSTALCKFGVGCSNARCTYSHPSPAADEKTGMVLSEEACEAGKNCKDAECVKSHVSPAAVHGESAGPSRVLCKFQHCTNSSCQFRHEDENGNFIPPPALGKSSAPIASDEVEVTVKKPAASLDAALDDAKTERPCRYGERCTRADCKFVHPASRPTPRGGKPATRGGAPAAKRAAPEDGIVGAMPKSTKFAPKSTLNPSAGEFKPGGAAGDADPEIQVTM